MHKAEKIESRINIEPTEKGSDHFIYVTAPVCAEVSRKGGAVVIHEK